MKKSKPHFFFERKIWKKGYKRIAGVDEVGRGCFAGPVVAGCVVFAQHSQIPKSVRIDDSKKITPRQREKGADWIRQKATSWGVGEVSTSVINRLGMAKATKMAFRKSVSEARKRLGKSIDYLLIDAFFIPYVRGNPKGRQMTIVDGDEKSLSIAAASMIAKVYRDRIMLKLGKKPKFKKYGITRYHRKDFVKNFLPKADSI